MEDILVVYYSLERNTEFVAEKIAEASKGDLLKIEPAKEIPDNPVGKYVVGGFKALFKSKPQLKSFNFNSGDYSLLYIGTPVWAGRMTPAIRSWLSDLEVKNKSIRLFCTARADSGKALEEMKNYLEPDNEIIDEIEFINPLQNKAEIEQKIKKWVK